VGWFLFVAVAFTMTQVGAPPWAALVEHGLGFVLFIAFMMDAYRIRRSGLVRGDARGVHFDGKLLAGRDRIATAYLVLAEQPQVHVGLHHGDPFDLRFEAEGDALALLQSLGIGIGQSTATFRAYYGHRSWLMVLLLLSSTATVTGVLLSGQDAHNRAPVLFPILVSIAVYALWRYAVRVDVGTDGILLRSLGQTRFVAYHALESAALERSAIVLTLHAGEKIVLSTGASHEQAQSRDALVERIEHARNAHAEAGDIAHAEALVAPAGRAVDKWLEDVRGLARAHDYRRAFVDADRLWRVVGDASVTAATRAGAALALASAPDQETLRRLRIAADSCVDPPLRVALSLLAERADDFELTEALEILVPDPRER
jgi:hypothetical protein